MVAGRRNPELGAASGIIGRPADGSWAGLGPIFTFATEALQGHGSFGWM
jgi:hypothetical protein